MTIFILSGKPPFSRELLNICFKGTTIFCINFLRRYISIVRHHLFTFWLLADRGTDGPTGRHSLHQGLYIQFFKC